MGRYTNVQSYADNSQNMRTISYEQATGRAANEATLRSDRPARAASEVQQHPSSPRNGRDTQEEGNATITGEKSGGANDTASTSQLKSDDAKESQQEQEQCRSANSPTSCNTTSLFVGSLHPRIGDLHLQKLFSPYGEIVRIHIVTHNPHENKSSNVHSKAATPAKYGASLHQSKGYAFVEYKNIESARLAMSRLDGRQLMGKNLVVRPSHRKTNAGGSGDSGKGGTEVSAEEARREYGAVSSKIEAVKRAIEQKKKGL